MPVAPGSALPANGPTFPAPARPRLSADFWAFLVGQTISNLGDAVTMFLLPLLVYRLTGSAFNLGLATAAHFLPYLLFGLVLGAWVDRVDRKRLMIATDVARALVIASVPALAALDSLAIWWLYAATFVNATLGIAFGAAQFAAIPSLVGERDLVTANGRIQASYSAALVVGPLLAGALLPFVPLERLLLFDAGSFLLSAVSLALVRAGFNRPIAGDAAQPRRPSLHRDIAEGLRYVWGHPVLRAISIMIALVNFVATTSMAQLVLFARERLGASEVQAGLLFSAGSAGVIVLSLAAGALRRRWSFSRVALGALMLDGLLTIALAWNRAYWLAVPLWAAITGLGVLFNINTGSLRQAIVPNHLLGRVISVAMVLAWSVNPLGTLLGGLLIERTGNVALIYGTIGALIVAIALVFSCTALGHAERYLPAAEAAPTNEPSAAEPTVSVSDPVPETLDPITAR